MHGAVVGLVLQGGLVQVVTEETQGEDRKCEQVTSVVGVTEYTGQVVLAVLYTDNQKSI